jgi:hypothetical protein
MVDEATGNGLRGGRDCCRISNEKKTPANGALNPADTPAEAPADNNNRFRCIRATVSASVSVRADKEDGIQIRLTAMPTSTDGPSGPKEFPVPNVKMAAKGFRNNRAPLAKRSSDSVLSEIASTS